MPSLAQGGNALAAAAVGWRPVGHVATKPSQELGLLQAAVADALEAGDAGAGGQAIEDAAVVAALLAGWPVERFGGGGDLARDLAVLARVEVRAGGGRGR